MESRKVTQPTAEELMAQLWAEAKTSHEAELARAEWEKNDDPTPWCLHCGPRSACDCGPIADNN